MKHITTIRFERHLFNRLKEMAEAKRCTVSDLVNNAVARYLFNEDALGNRLDATRNAIDNNHDELKEVIRGAVVTMKQESDMQLVKLGELIAMLIDEQPPKPTRSTKPKPTATTTSVDSHWDQVNSLNK